MIIFHTKRSRHTLNVYLCIFMIMTSYSLTFMR